MARVTAGAGLQSAVCTPFLRKHLQAPPFSLLRVGKIIAKARTIQNA